MRNSKTDRINGKLSIIKVHEEIPGYGVLSYIWYKENTLLSGEGYLKLLDAASKCASYLICLRPYYGLTPILMPLVLIFALLLLL